MCNSFSSDCEGCRVDEEKPVMSECCLWMFENPERAVKIVEEWSAAHPRKTWQSVFLELWPDADIGANGVVAISPCSFLKEYRQESKYIATTVDAVPVVRCKDCKHYGMGACLKIYSDGNVHAAAWQKRKPDDFCSYGERKDCGDADR